MQFYNSSLLYTILVATWLVLQYLWFKLSFKLADTWSRLCTWANNSSHSLIISTLYSHHFSFFIFFAALSGLCALFIVESMQCIPGNKHFQGTGISETDIPLFSRIFSIKLILHSGIRNANQLLLWTKSSSSRTTRSLFGFGFWFNCFNHYNNSINGSWNTHDIR